MEKRTSDNIGIGGFYWANIGRQSMPTTFMVERPTAPVRERVKAIGIDGDKIVVESTSDMRAVITCKVDFVEV